MSDPQPPQPPEGPDPIADSPLFRELQRVLRSGGGPVNWELARQVAVAMTSLEQDDPEPTASDRAGLEGAVRMAELAVAEATGLSVPPMRTEVVRRARWVEANVTGLRAFFEPVATRMSDLLRRAREDEGPEAAEGGMMMEAVLGQLGPLLMGAQVGTVLGQLGTRVLGNYELPVPRDVAAVVFVAPNIAAFEREWSLDPDEFRAWLALHEVAHASGLHHPWVRNHVIGLVAELAAGIELDLAGLERRLGNVDPSNPQALSEALGDPSELFGGEPTGERKLLADRLRSFGIAAEGHAGHILRTTGRERLSSFARIEEAMRRRHEDRGQDERMADRLLGLDLEPEQYRLGERFCETVVERTDELVLARMWASAEAFPSMPELEEPTLWLSRIA